jgi:NDP-sugar pyrophosphorylase family protein
VLEPETFDRIPRGVSWSIERSFFPSLVERGETFVAYVDRGYWIDIGTPEKYRQVHHDVMDGRYRTPVLPANDQRLWISPQARVDQGVTVEGPCFIDEGSTVKAGARIGPYAVIGRNCHVEEQATIQESIVWANTRVCQEASVRASILGRNCHVGRSASVLDGVVLGDKSVVTEFSKL